MGLVRAACFGVGLGVDGTDEGARFKTDVGANGACDDTREELVVHKVGMNPVVRHGGGGGGHGGGGGGHGGGGGGHGGGGDPGVMIPIYAGAMAELIHSPSSSLQNHNNDGNVKNREDRDDHQLSLLALLLALFRKSFWGSSNSTVAEEPLDLSGMEIGRPTDVRHVAHVTFDRFNGFLGLPVEFEPELSRRAPSASAIVFGVSTESMQLSYDSRGNSIPVIIMLMQQHLYSQGGLQAEGIFRINADNNQEEHLRNQLNSGVVPDGIDVHCLAGLIKRTAKTGILDPLSPEQMADPLTALMYAVQVMNFLKTLISKTLRERRDLAIESSQASPRESLSDENGDQGPGLNPHLQENDDEHEFITDNDHLGYSTATDESDGPGLHNWSVQSSPIKPKTQMVKHTHKPEPVAQSSDQGKNRPLVTNLSSINSQTE
ncbi:hypothetical protein L1987_10359 [Smallanthus sonchifolius]|uniref:Uncharacterized protein n=1 Tax=Smallanthus sonchifolius TaxID=185202 RepID=A0ACB9JRU1_9ASTR|nr:hypothetical protein L1987_10359 [Smallanthus sonchifolius]